jgi:hypothetical protein
VADKLYGIDEIAQALEAKRDTVSKWYRRGKLPRPDAVLGIGPVWKARTIAPMIRAGGPKPKPSGRPRKAR